MYTTSELAKVGHLSRLAKQKPSPPTPGLTSGLIPPARGKTAGMKKIICNYGKRAYLCDVQFSQAVQAANILLSGIFYALTTYNNY